MNSELIDREFLQLAEEAARTSNCVSRHVGCVIAQGTSVIVSGWNGVHAVSSDVSCVAAGCPHCTHAETVTGVGNDRCICVHAEQTAIAAAAKIGIAVKDATLYSTLRPCLNCAGSTLAAGIERVVYSRDWQYAENELEKAHRELSERFIKFAFAAERPLELASA